jgi:branched-chain amino acid aminotransferase
VFVNVNGQLLPAQQAMLPVTSPMVRWGVSLIETMRWQRGEIPLFALHMLRLFRGMEAFDLVAPPPFTPEFLFSEIQNLVKNNGHLSGARVRLQLGPAGGRLGGENEAGIFYFIESEPLKLLEYNSLGLNICISDNHRVLGESPYSAYKRGSALVYFGAAQEAHYRGFDDVLMLTASSCIGESSRANVFWEEGGQLYTPPLSEGIVSGVARARLLQVLSQQDSPPTEALLTPERLWTADALYLTNAVQGVRWIASCEGRKFAAGTSATLHNCLFGSAEGLAHSL